MGGLWRKRWTVLQSNTNKIKNGNVSTYKKEKIYEKPTESIRIDTNTDIEAFIDKKAKQDRDEWIECITNNVHRASIEEVVNGINNYHNDKMNGAEEEKQPQNITHAMTETKEDDVENKEDKIEKFKATENKNEDLQQTIEEKQKNENDATKPLENMDKIDK